jgi:GNAT superfamily N-acetyltransferase
MQLEYRSASPLDAQECIRIRGLTRENAISAAHLASMGITVESWAEGIRARELPGFVCMAGNEMAGYCFGDASTGEVVVLALQPEYEDLGIGRELLARVVAHLHGLGHTRLFLGCSADPAVRSFGFYRHLGWQGTGTVDQHGDEVLELVPRSQRGGPDD